MSKRTIVLLSIAALGLFLVFVIARFPAQHALALASKYSQGAVMANHVQGTLWQGSAENLYVSLQQQTVDLGQSQWKIDFLPLLLAKLSLTFDAKKGVQKIQTELLASSKKVQIKELHANIPIAPWMKMLPFPMDVRGEVALDLQDSTLNQQGIERLNGNVVVKDAEVNFGQQIILGTYAAKLSMQDDYVLADITDLDATIGVTGTAKASLAARKYSSYLQFTPNEKTDAWINQSLPMVAKKQNDGSYVFQYDGQF